MKRFILTMDYELFLGSNTGDVYSCMYLPTMEIAKLLSKNGDTMTVFWDILHYYKLIEYREIFKELQKDILLIENQICTLYSEGHDIQLHLHPHWLDAVYENSQWKFKYNRFRLHDLSIKHDENDITTIVGCINISKRIIEDLIKKIDSNYKVTTFRAGGYLIAPFSDLREALIKNNILIESSICTGLKNSNGIFSFDFSEYPKLVSYRFSLDPRIVDNDGIFTELPIQTVKIPIIYNIYFKFLRYTKYRYFIHEFNGTGAGATTNIRTSLYHKLFYLFFQSGVYQFTLDGSFKELFFYMFKKLSDNSTLILHSKMLNGHAISLLEELLETNTIRFKSIKEFVNE